MIGDFLQGQVPVTKPLVQHPPGDEPHLLEGVALADVAPPGEFRHIVPRVLLAEVVERAVVSALQQAPEALHAVCVGLPLERTPRPSA